jgi:hypothetical protein
VLAVPGVDRRDPQRPPRLALVVGVADVVVGLVGLPDPRVGVGRGAVLGAEAADVHVPEVQARLAAGDPLGHHPADPAGAGEAVGAEAGADEEAADLRFAEAELVVGGEGLGAVDQLGDGDPLHRRQPPLRVLDDLLEAVPVLFQQAAVEVGRDPLQPAGSLRQEGRLAAALVAAHHQAVAVLAVVDEEVGVTQGGEVPAVAGGGDLLQRLGDQVLVGHRQQRHPHAGHPGDLGGVHAAGVDDYLRLDVAAVGVHAAHTSLAHLDPRHPGMGEDAAAAAAGAVGEGVGQLRRVDVAVGGQPGGAEHALGGHQRKHLLCILGGDQLQRQAEGLRPAGLAAQLLHPLLAGGEPDAAALHPSRVELRLVA